MGIPLDHVNFDADEIPAAGRRAPSTICCIHSASGEERYLDTAEMTPENIEAAAKHAKVEDLDRVSWYERAVLVSNWIAAGRPKPAVTVSNLKEWLG